MDHKYSPIAAIAGIALLVAISLLMLNQLPNAQASSGDQSSTPVMMSTGPLTPPPTVYPPSQADNGAQVYFQVCMVCHGDRGQGLTKEFRDILQPPDNNCWASHCHGPNHPSDGFTFPKVVPALVGPYILPSFKTARGLHDFIQGKMPFQAPGSLTKDEYWQLTAFVMRLNGADPGKQNLDDASAAAISFGKATPPPLDTGSALGSRTSFYFLVAGGIAAALIVLFAMLRRRK